MMSILAIIFVVVCFICWLTGESEAEKKQKELEEKVYTVLLGALIDAEIEQNRARNRVHA